MDVFDLGVRRLRRGHELRVGAIGDVDPADVVVLAVIATRGGLVKPLKPVRADQRRMRGALLRNQAIASISNDITPAAPR